MKRSLYVLVCATALYVGPVRAAAYPDATLSYVLPSDAADAAEEDSDAPSGPGTSRVLGIPDPEPAPELESVEKRGFPGLPTFSRNVLARGRSYRFTMVGTDPFVANPGRTVVPVQIVPVRVMFNDGTVLDPSIPGPACAGNGTPLTDTLQSPLFTNSNYGDGNRQYVEEARRVEFWAVTGTKPGYSVRVAPTVLPTITLAVAFPSVAATCGRTGTIPYSSLDSLLRTAVFPQLRKLGVSPKTFPVFLFSNVFFKVSNVGLAAGYHSVFNLDGTQTYGVAEYDTRLGSHSTDVSVLSHELAEWYDDPFVNNATPPWGHIGQVTGCQSNLEVGDPLTGHVFGITMPNGLTYHPQELAFFSWFFDQVPSLGLEGRYSWGGTLSTPAALCQ